MCPLKFGKTHRKTPVRESLFKESWRGYLKNICKRLLLKYDRYSFPFHFSHTIFSIVITLIKNKFYQFPFKLLSELFQLLLGGETLITSASLLTFITFLCKFELKMNVEPIIMTLWLQMEVQIKQKLWTKHVDLSV